MTSSKSGPKDSLVMASILKDMGIIDYEPRVVHQMLEFTYRYITNILEDAKAFSNHAKKKNLDIDDVKLAIQMQMDKGFTTPPPRDILIDISRQRNNIPLPLIKPHCGPRLPPDRYCLSACNYRLKTAKRNTIKGLTPKLNLQTPTGAKITPAVNLTSKSGAALSLVTKGVTTPTVTIVTRPAVTIALNTGTTTTAKLGGVAATPCPLIKITPGQPATTTTTASLIGSISSSTANLGSASSTSSTIPIIPKTPVIRTVVTAAKPSEIIGDISLKRKREEDDDYDAE